MGKKITETNISDWRRTVCGDLTSVFRPYNGENIANPEFLKKDPFLEGIHKAQFKKLPDDYKLLTKAEIDLINRDPHASPYMPQQEKGIRPSCALPYELYADGKLNADKTAFEIKFASGKKIWGDKAVGAPFNVYAPGSYLDQKGNFENVRTWAYGLTAGDSLADQWPLKEFEDKNYHLRIYGPNGFFREFKGNAEDPSVHIDFNYQHALTDNKKFTGNVELVLTNLSGKAQAIEITDHAYKSNNHKKALPASGKATLVLDLEKSHHWYDFSVKITGHHTFEKRYAGRVETGKSGYSDPFMGKVV
jgi:phospholipase C